ncbi:hypothetical protein [Streptomyces sp. NPDC096013]|uniref:hypothetical protein n=1 Tax=Streptomyces sp. NPDC096013 TaxID=3366069 RepID=UPI00380AA3E2
MTITEGPFATLRATVTEIDAPTQKIKGVIKLFGRHSPVELTFTGTPNELRVTAVQDRSQIIATHRDATRHFGVVGCITSGKDAGRYIRVDGMAALDEPAAEHTGSAEVMIRVADDPGMQINCVGEWVEDWAGVEESFRLDHRQVDWDH